MPSDREIIEGIVNHDSNILGYIYEEILPYVDAFVVHQGGSSENARDVFQEGMIIIYRKIEAGQLELQCKFSTYLYAVCKRIWIQERKKQLQRMDKLKEMTAVAESVPPYGIDDSNEIRELFDKHFNKLSPACQKMLRLYFNGLTLEDIREVMEIKTVHHVSDKKYRCKKNLVERIKGDPAFRKIIR